MIRISDLYSIQKRSLDFGCLLTRFTIRIPSVYCKCCILSTRQCIIIFMSSIRDPFSFTNISLLSLNYSSIYFDSSQNVLKYGPLNKFILIILKLVSLIWFCRQFVLFSWRRGANWNVLCKTLLIASILLHVETALGSL